MKAQESDMKEGNHHFSFTTENSIMVEARVIDDENDPFWDLPDPGIAATRWTPGGSSSDTKPSSLKRKRSLYIPHDPPAGDDIVHPSRLSKYLHDDCFCRSLLGGLVVWTSMFYMHKPKFFQTVGSIAIEWYPIPAFLAIGVGAQVLASATPNSQPPYPYVQRNLQAVIYDIILICMLWTTFSALYFSSGTSL